ncbi:MAG: hypothetical protein DDT34_00892 [Firmicutes bacterium]|nr:hypothetical protein [Bacillota bacterium]MBT9152091.1 hypothetical protein [Bacillota bacterium]
MDNVIRKILILFRGRILGASLGITFALMLIIFGVWQTVFILVCGVIGYYLGARFDSDEDFRGFLERVLPPVD